MADVKAEAFLFLGFLVAVWLLPTLTTQASGFIKEAWLAHLAAWAAAYAVARLAVPWLAAWLLAAAQKRGPPS